MGALDKCAAYLDACGLYSLSTKQVSAKLQELAGCLSRGKHLSLVNAQLCAVLSQLGQHKQALEKAKASLRLALYCIDCTIQAYKVINSRQRTKTTTFDTISDLQKTAKLALPLLKSIQQVLKSAQVPAHKDPIVVHPDWVYELAIADVMLLEPVAAAELKGKASIREEFSVDFVLDKVVNVAVAYFCMATELHFLKKSADFDPERDREEYCPYRELFHLRALRLLESFFPCDCPLLQHVAQTYQNRFPPRLPKHAKSALPSLGIRHLPAKRTRKPSLETRSRVVSNAALLKRGESLRSTKGMKDRRNRSAELVRQSPDLDEYSSSGVAIVS